MRLSIALIALGLVAAPVSAEEVTLRVAYDDAELTTDIGYAAVAARITAAADSACAVSDEWVLSYSPSSDCKAKLTRLAMAELDSRREALAAQP
jgi:UrcA family protein